MREVLATTGPTPRWLWGMAAVQAANFALWTVRLVRGDDDAVVVMAVTLAVAVAAATVALVGGRRVRLVLTDDALHVERRFRPVTVPRAAVRGVRGDVPDRPGWSQAVLVELDGRVVRLPAVDAPPSVLVPRLQAWARVGERARTDPGAAAPPTA